MTRRVFYFTDGVINILFYLPHCTEFSFSFPSVIVFVLIVIVLLVIVLISIAVVLVDAIRYNDVLYCKK